MKKSTINTFIKVTATGILLLISSKLLANEKPAECINSSNQKVAAEYVGSWRGANNENSLAILEIGNEGQISFILDSEYSPDLLPKPMGFLVTKPNGEVGFRHSCAYFKYLKSMGKSESEIATEIKDSESSQVKVSNGELVTYSVHSEQKYKKLSQEEVNTIKQRHETRDTKINVLKVANFKPLIGKKFKLLNRISNGFYSDGKAFSLTQQADELNAEYDCGQDLCFNTKTLHVISLDESIVNNTLKATNIVYLKEFFSKNDGFKNDLVGINVKQNQNTSYFVLVGEFIYSSGNLKVIQQYNLKDGSTFESINNFIEIQ